MENCHTWIIISMWQNDLHTNTSRSVWPIIYGLMIKMLQYKMYPAGELAVLRQLLFFISHWNVSPIEYQQQDMLLCWNMKNNSDLISQVLLYLVPVCAMVETQACIYIILVYLETSLIKQSRPPDHNWALVRVTLFWCSGSSFEPVAFSWQILQMTWIFSLLI